VLLLHLVLSPVLFCPWTAEVFEGPKAALLTATALILTGLAASSWFARGLRLRPRLPPDLATLGLVLFVGSAALSTVFSISPLQSWRGAPESRAGLQTLLGYLILYAATRSLCRTAEDGSRLWSAVVVASAASAAYAMIQAAHLDPVAWAGVSAFGDCARPFGTFGHANFLSAYLVMAAPLLAVFLLRALAGRRWVAALALALIGAAAGAAVVASLSRAAWLAAAAAALILGCGWWLSGSRRAGLVVLGLTAGACATALSAVVMSSLTADPAAAERGLAGRVAARLGRLDDDEGRWHIWRASWDLFRDRPILGCGPDALQLAFGAHRPVDYANVEWDTTPARAHNVVLHVLATQGAVGAATAAVFAVGLALAAIQAWRRAGPANRPLVVAVAASLVAFLVQDLFGFTVVGCGTLFVTGAAQLSRWGEREASGAVSPEHVPGPFLGVSHAAVALATIAALYILVIRPMQGSVACASGDHVVAIAPREALACYERAVALTPEDDHAWTQLGAAASQASRQAADLDERRRLLGQAGAAFERAAALVPAAPCCHANLGRLLGEMTAAGLARGDDALAQWDVALAAEPRNAVFLAEAARTALAVGRYDRARSWIARGLEIYPQYGLLYAQQGACDFAEGRLDRAADALEHALHADWHYDGEGVAHALATFAAVELARNEYDHANQLAGAACGFDPGWATPCLLKARALRGLGRGDEAGNQYRRVLTLDPDNAEARAAVPATAP
jgi:O-antigen ligase